MQTDKTFAASAQPWDIVTRYAPGVLLAAVIALLAGGIQSVEEQVLGHALIESLVVAILLGTLWRTWRGVGARVQPGVAWTAKQVLEFAIVLLGASVDLPALLKGGPALLLAVVVAVAVGITASVTIGRLIGLNSKLAILVAVGNSICGNSAIAAVAPVINADADDIASSIALTAVLGVVVVLALPLLIPLVGLTLYQYGILAGMTVYAVPQVLAATFSVSTISGEIGTLVKLMRVLLLGPVVLFFSLRYPAERSQRFSIARFVPWFILGFIALAVLRSVGLLPVSVADIAQQGSRYLTIAAMAALGLGVDVRAVRKVGLSVGAAVVLSLLVLIVVALTLIAGLGLQ
jgi:uncharacterized integral membrane protein (TIGR00698 family)